MTSELELAQGQATMDVMSAILISTGEAMIIHGNDPDSLAILSAGFCLAIEEISKSIDPTFKRRILLQLNPSR
jgi:hypothetical protein